MKRILSLDTFQLEFGKLLEQTELKMSSNADGYFGLFFDDGSENLPGIFYSPESSESALNAPVSGSFSAGWNVRHSGADFEPIDFGDFVPITFTSSNLTDGKVEIVWDSSAGAKAIAPFGFGYSHEPDLVEFAAGKIYLYYSSIIGTYAVWFAGSAQSMLV